MTVATLPEGRGENSPCGAAPQVLRALSPCSAPAASCALAPCTASCVPQKRRGRRRMPDAVMATYARRAIASLRVMHDAHAPPRVRWFLAGGECS